MKRIIRKLFFRGTTIREYSPVAIGGEISEKVYLEMPDRVLDVSQTHWLLSLEPVVLGVWIANNEVLLALGAKPVCKIYFSDRGIGAIASAAHGTDLATAGSEHAADVKKIGRYAVATANLEFFDKIVEKDGTLFLFKMIKSRIRHLPSIRILLLFLGFYKKPRLSFSQFRSLAASHSYPRQVRVVSFREGPAFNIFPMDLLGNIPGSKRFVFGLRHSNHSLPRIAATKKIVVSDAPSEYKNMIYQLGKHHQSGPLAMDALPFRTIRTGLFAFDIPEWVESYREISLSRTMDLGSHMLLWGQTLNEATLKNPAPHLFHIPFMLWLHQQKRGKEYPLA